VRYIQRRWQTVARDAAALPRGCRYRTTPCGQTTLLRKLFSKAQYVLLEYPDFQARVRSDPRAFLEAIRPPVVCDEDVYLYQVGELPNEAVYALFEPQQIRFEKISTPTRRAIREVR
jgi:hypothetical protein